jgi:hypothetical protein
VVLRQSGRYRLLGWLPPIYSRYYHIELTWMLFYTLVIAGTQVVARFCAVGLVDWFGRVAPP